MGVLSMEESVLGLGLGLGDHVRVGPQWVPAATRGVPVVARGPHGMPLARPLSTDGSNLRWWKEAQFLPGQWQPKQAVTGVLGLAGRDATTEDKVQATKLVKGFESGTVAKPLVVSVLAQWNPWSDSSWWSGYDTYQSLIQRTSGLTWEEKHPDLATAAEAARRAASPVEAVETSAAYVGPRVRELASGVAKALEVPTWLKVVGVLGAAAVVAFVAQPYVTPYLRRGNPPRGRRRRSRRKARR